MTKEHFRLYVAVYLILEKDGKILLLRRCNTGYRDGYYSLIAGHIDGNEHPTQAMVREAKEEADITVDSGQLVVVHILHRINPDREYMDIFMKTREWSGNIRNVETHKCDSLDWHPINDLPENMIPEVKSALGYIQKGIFYSEYDGRIE